MLQGATATGAELRTGRRHAVRRGGEDARGRQGAVLGRTAAHPLARQGEGHAELPCAAFAIRGQPLDHHLRHPALPA